MKIRLASPLQIDSLVDGVGIRTVIWTQGCAHACPGCHNMATHDFKGGKEFELEEIKNEISNLVDIWLYTGFTYEEVLKMARGRELLSTIDVLVDGRFELAKRSLDAPFRGSTNQRIIDCHKTIATGKIVLVERLMRQKDMSPLYKRPDSIYI